MARFHCGTFQVHRAPVKDWDPDAGLPPSAMLNIKDMVLAEQLLQAFSQSSPVVLRHL